MKTPVTAAIYTRISQDKSGEGAGVERQEADCRALAAHRGMVVAAVFSDNDISAYNGARRPGFESMLHGVQAGQFDAIVTWKTDRLYRRTKDLERLVELTDAGVSMFTVNSGDIDLSTAVGRMLARILGSVAQSECEVMSERRRRSNLQRAEKGLHDCCARPFGYEKNQMTVREDEAAEIRKLADGALSGISLRSLATDLRAREVPNSRGAVNRWAGHEVKRILLNPRYAGLRVHRGRQVGPAVWPAILDMDTHEALKALLTDPARRVNWARPGPAPETLGTRIYRCATCDAPTMIRNGSNYVCSVVHTGGKTGAAPHPTRSIELLDAYVTGHLLGLLSEPGVLAAMRSRLDTEDIDIDALRREKSALKRKIDDAQAACSDERMTLDDFCKVTQKWRRRYEEVDLAERAHSAVSPLAEYTDAASVPAVWQRASLDKRRQTLAHVLTVTLHPGGGLGKQFNPDTIDVQLSEQARTAGVPALPPFIPPIPRPTTPQLSKTQIRQARKRYAAGESRQTIAADLHVSTQTVWRATEDLALTDGRNSHRVAFTPEQDAQIRARYANAEPVKSIAADLGVSPSTIYSRVRGTCLTDGRANQHAVLSAEQVQQVRAMRATGATLKAIAEHFGVSEWAVRNALPPGDLRQKAMK